MWGWPSLDLGQNDPTANQVVVDGQFNLTLVGQDELGEFDSTVTFSQLLDSIFGGNLDGLVGRFDIEGGVITDSDGVAIQDDNGLITQANIFEYELADNQLSNMVYMEFGDINLNVVGLSGLAADAIHGVTFSMGDIFDTQSYSYTIDSPVADALLGLKSGDLLDSMTSVASLLVQVGETMSNDLPFLATEIPLINISLLDVVDFSEDFLIALQEIEMIPTAH